MTDEELIRRGDALAVVTNGQTTWGEAVAAIRALPAVTVGVKPLVWCEANDGNYKKGECFTTRSPISFAPIAAHKKHDGWWLNVDCNTHPTLEAAKAAAQADYEARILAALEPVVGRDHPDYLTSAAADHIEALGAEVARLTQERDAASAAAYEAAGEIAAEFIHRRLYEANMPVCSYHSRDIKTAIRALATPDQTAAMDRVRAEANAEGMRAAAALMTNAAKNCRDKFTYPPKTQEQRDYQTGAIIHNNAAEAILAAIPKPEGV